MNNANYTCPFFSVTAIAVYVRFRGPTPLCGKKLFKYFSVAQVNSLRFEFGLFNSICGVLVLLLEFLNLNDLSIILVGKKACFFFCQKHACHLYLKISFQNGLLTELYYHMYLFYLHFLTFLTLIVFFGISKGTLEGFLSLIATSTVSFWECVYLAFVRMDRFSNSIFVIVLLELFSFLKCFISSLQFISSTCLSLCLIVRISSIKNFHWK